MSNPDDSTTIEAIRTVFAALDDAFERRDENAILSMTTADQVTIMPNFAGPQPLTESLRSLSDVKIEKRVVSEFAVTVLGPDAALVTHVADMEGTYRGEPLPSRAFVSGIMVRRDGRWLEKTYQVTTLKP